MHLKKNEKYYTNSLITRHTKPKHLKLGPSKPSKKKGEQNEVINQERLNPQNLETKEYG
jgi:hypothetical protein